MSLVIAQLLVARTAHAHQFTAFEGTSHVVTERQREKHEEAPIILNVAAAGCSIVRKQRVVEVAPLACIRSDIQKSRLQSWVGTGQRGVGSWAEGNRT